MQITTSLIMSFLLCAMPLAVQGQDGPSSQTFSFQTQGSAPPTDQATFERLRSQPHSGMIELSIFDRRAQKSYIGWGEAHRRTYGSTSTAIGTQLYPIENGAKVAPTHVLQRPAQPPLVLQSETRMFDAMRNRNPDALATSIWKNTPNEIRFERLVDEMAIELSTVRRLAGDELLQKQVRPGVGIEGGEGPPAVCKGCGSKEIVTAGMPIMKEPTGHEGPVCPTSICPDTDGSGVKHVGCSGPLCWMPKRAALPLTKDGRVDVSYRKSGYPELMPLVTPFTFEESGALGTIVECSATAISKYYVVTALHCIAGNENQLRTKVDTGPGPISGWTTLVPKFGSNATLAVVSGKDQTTVLIHEAYVPYDTANDIQFLPNNSQACLDDPLNCARVATIDLAVLRLKEPGLQLMPLDYPILSFSGLVKDSAISFAGFGWTDFAGVFGEQWDQLALSARLETLKNTAFNFLDGRDGLVDGAPKKLTWRTGVPSGTGGPCEFDSGGPIYAGFNRGFWNSPRMLVGVVSGIRRPKDNVATGIPLCLDPLAVGYGEDLALYQSGICQITGNNARGCE
ncbi:MAG: trypsin-like serine protease [Paracoccaceae bacterium]